MKEAGKDLIDTVETFFRGHKDLNDKIASRRPGSD